MGWQLIKNKFRLVSPDGTDFSSGSWTNGGQRKNRGKDRNTKFKYPENEKSFLGKIKRIFHNYLRAIIW